MLIYNTTIDCIKAQNTYLYISIESTDVYIKVNTSPAVPFRSLDEGGSREGLGKGLLFLKSVIISQCTQKNLF